MPITPTYPGVYIEEVPSGVRTIVGVSTSVAAFIGYTQRGPTNEAVQIFSPSDYERQFGGFNKDSPVSYAVHHFFLNGGTEAWIVRVADGAAAATAMLKSGVTVPDPDVLVVTAKSEGAWGNNLRLDIDYDTVNPLSLFNLTVTELVDQAGRRVPGRVEKHRNLSMNAFSPGWVEGVVDAASELVQVARTSAAALAVQNASATSTSGVLPPNVWLSVGNDHRRLALSLHGAPPVEFDFLPPSPPPLGNMADLVNALQQALNAAFPAAGVTVAAINSDTQLQFNAAVTPPNGERSQLRFMNASMRSAAAVLRLGVANGGEEVDGTASIRPAQSGTRAGAAPDLAALSPASTIQVTIEAPSLPADGPHSLALWAAANKPASLEEVRVRLQDGLRSSDKPALNESRVTLDTRGLRVVAGGPNPNVRLVFTGVPADELELTAAQGAIANLAAYAPGAEGLSTQAQVAGAAGHDGTPPAATSLQGNQSQKTGIYALEDVDIFNILCLPDQSDTALLSAAIAYAAERRAFVVLDFPADVDSPAGAKQWLNDHGTLRHKNAAIYFPRVHLSDPLDNGRPRAFPAAPLLAGVYARTDAARGVWKAPAGTEARLLGVQKMDVPLTDPENGTLNPLAINCIRSFPVYGPVVWGSRTLEGADVLASESKYVPVRRLTLMLEESLYRGTKWVVFEPNDEPLWAQIRLNVGAFMQTLFRQGAFQGTTPREAYFVKCDKETTTQTDINLGIVNILVGFAPLKPAEFVIIKIQQIAGQIPT